MINYRCKISYDGTSYQGWQIQPGERPTIQKCLIESLIKILNSEDVSVVGSGRTDTGVHALGQVCKIKTPKDLDPRKLKQALNSLLPDKILVNELSYCDESFHPIHSAKSKQYDYLFTVGRDSCPPQIKNSIYELTHSFDEELARLVCEAYLGKHDFINFMNQGTPVNSTVREIYQCELSYVEADPFWSQAMQGYWKFSVTGEGFLKQMVRLMVGAMFSVARGYKSLDDLKQSIEGSPDSKIGPVAPPQGLYLVNVTY